MTKQRLTRAEKSAQTRAELMASARRLFLRHGFHACSLDLEDELLRALGTDAVEAAIGEAGEAQSLRLLAGMPAQRGWTREAVLRRFLTSQAGRKVRYAALLVTALGADRAPAPLAAVLASVER